jgi:hypothetical protein
MSRRPINTDRIAVDHHLDLTHLTHLTTKVPTTSLGMQMIFS